MKKGCWIVIIAILSCVVGACVLMPGGRSEKNADVLSATGSFSLQVEDVQASKAVSEDTPDLRIDQVQQLQEADSALITIADQVPQTAVLVEPANEVATSNIASPKPATSALDDAENKVIGTDTGPHEEPSAAAVQPEEPAVVSAPEKDPAPKAQDEDASSVIIPEPDDHKTNEVHTHSYVLNSSKPASCLEAGLNIYTCECGDSYEEIIPAPGHQWELASTFEVTDSESYCKFKCAVLTCTSPECIQDGRFITVFNAKDYGYSYEKLYSAYSSHASMHLADGKQASYTTQTARCTEPAAFYDQLLFEQNKTLRVVLSLELIPAVTHTEHAYRCSRCGAEK